MFNKSILAAALLTVGTIAGGSAVSAAEIGVRNTTGFSTRDVTGGQSSYVRHVTGQYSEDSVGFALGITADDFEVDTSRGRSSYSYNDSYTAGTFEGDAVGTVDIEGDDFVYGPNWALGGEAPVDLALSGTFEGTSYGVSDEIVSRDRGLEVDGSLTVSGSAYERHESGDITENLTETYSFTGSSRSDFSELSTFSR